MRDILGLIGDEFVKKKRGFCSSQTRLEKHLSVFVQVSQIETYGGFFETHFAEIRQISQESDFAIFSQLVFNLLKVG